MNSQDATLVDAKLEELRPLRDQLSARIKQLEEAKAMVDTPSQRPETKAEVPTDLEAKLSKLPWKEAQSRKCEYMKGDAIPSPLSVEVKATAVNGELKLAKFHYVIKPDGAILRFRRRGN